MTFGSVFGRTFSPTFQPKSQAVVAGGGWWDLNGTITSCVAAYQPKGAASYAASKVNLTGNTTYDATEGNAPPWDATTGWGSFTSDNKHLKTGITPSNDQSYSMIFRCLTSPASGTWAIGSWNTTGPGIFAIRPWRAPAKTYGSTFGNGNGSVNDLSDNTGSTVFAVAGDKAYIDGDYDVSLPGWSGATPRSIYIGGLNYGAGVGDSVLRDSCFGGYILAVAIYSATLTSTQVGALTTAMNAL